MWTLLEVKKPALRQCWRKWVTGWEVEDMLFPSTYGLSPCTLAGPQGVWLNMQHQTREGHVKTHSEQGFSPLGTSLSLQFSWTCFIIFTPFRNALGQNCNSRKRRKEVFRNIKREAWWGQCILHYCCCNGKKKTEPREFPTFLMYLELYRPCEGHSGGTQSGHGGVGADFLL